MLNSVFTRPHFLLFFLSVLCWPTNSSNEESKMETLKVFSISSLLIKSPSLSSLLWSTPSFIKLSLQASVFQALGRTSRVIGMSPAHLPFGHCCSRLSTPKSLTYTMMIVGSWSAYLPSSNLLFIVAPVIFLKYGCPPWQQPSAKVFSSLSLFYFPSFLKPFPGYPMPLLTSYCYFFFLAPSVKIPSHRLE